MLTNYLAEIWGISLVIVCLALLIRQKHLKKLFPSVESDDSLFSWGLVTLVIGIAMVLSHNIWVKDWQVVITIIGWISLIKGMSLLFFTEYTKSCVKKLENAPFLPFLLFIGIFMGLIITYLGFTA